MEKFIYLPPNTMSKLQPIDQEASIVSQKNNEKSYYCDQEKLRESISENLKTQNFDVTGNRFYYT